MKSSDKTPSTSAARVGKPQFSTHELMSGESLSNLIHRLCHEVDNPLTAIISLATVLERAFSNTDESVISPAEKVPFYSRSIVEEAWRVNSLLEKLLLLATTRGGAPTTAEADRLVFTALAEIRDNELFQDIPIDFDIPDTPPLITIDNAQFVILGKTLLENAHQSVAADLGVEVNNPAALPDVPPIQIYLRGEGDDVLLSIASTTDRSCSSELTSLFEPFVRDDPTSRRLGWGLTVAWAIVERAGGELLLAEEEIDGRYRFTTQVRLPKRLSAETADPTSAADGAAHAAGEAELPETVSVLIIEDEITVASAIQKILELQLGSKTQLSCDCVLGQKALSLFSEGSSFDAVLCDLNLNDVNGASIFESVCKDRPDLRMKFGFLTGDRSSSETELFLKSTRQPYLLKPFEPEALVQLVIGLVSRS